MFSTERVDGDYDLYTISIWVKSFLMLEGVG